MHPGPLALALQLAGEAPAAEVVNSAPGHRADPACNPAAHDPAGSPAFGAPSAASVEPDTTSALAFADDDADLQAALLASMMDTDSSPAADGVDRPAMLNPSSPLFAQFERPPLVSTPEPLAPRVALQLRTSDAGRRALVLLGEFGARLVRIRGDGHCMFRALGAGLVLAVREMTPSRARQIGASLSRLLVRAPVQPLGAHGEGARSCGDAFGSSSITSASGAATSLADDEQALDLLGALHDGSLPSNAREAICAALAAQQSSDALVAALRLAACEHMRAHAPRFRACEAALGSSWDAYLSQMERLWPDDNSPRYGGAIELVALSERLGCLIHVYDLELIHVDGTARGGPTVAPSYEFSSHVEACRDDDADEGVAAMDGASDEPWVLLGARPHAQPPLGEVRLALMRAGLHYHLMSLRE